MAVDCNNKIGNDMTFEYDTILSEMKEQIEIYKREVKKLINRVEDITSENERLHADLKNAYELHLASQTKEDTEMWRQSSTEQDMELSLNNSKLKNDLMISKKELKISQKLHEELQNSYDELLLKHQQSLQAINHMQSELSAMKKELLHFQKQAKTSNEKNIELQTLLNNVRQQMKEKSSDIKEDSLDQRAYILMTTNAELKSKLALLEEDVGKLTESKIFYEMKVVALNEKIEQLESREQTAVNHVKESMQLLETALADKEQADINEQHYVYEVKYLQQKIASLLEEAGSRTKLEVEKIREEYNGKIDIMASEIQQLERECCEKQSLIEKLQRDNAEINKETSPAEQTWIRDVLNEVRSKLLQSERKCDDLSSEVKLLKTAKSKLENSFLAEKQRNGELLEKLHLQRQQNQSDSQHFRNEINSLSNQCKLLQVQVSEITRTQEETENTYENKLRKTCDEFAMKEKEFVINMKSSQEIQQKMSLEFKKNLLAHQQAANRWQKEMFDLNNKFEKSIHDMNSKLSEAKQSNKDLISKFHQLTINNKTLEMQLTECKQANMTLNEKLSEVELLAEQRRQQISLLIVREQKAMKQKQQMHHLLHKARSQVLQNISATKFTEGKNQTMRISTFDNLSCSQNSDSFVEDISVPATEPA